MTEHEAETDSTFEAPTPFREAVGVSDVGRVRTRNEDQFVVAAYTPELRLLSTGLERDVKQPGQARIDEDLLVAVADGMGGHGGGDVASRLAIEAVIDAFAPSPPETWSVEAFVERIKMAVREAEKRLDAATSGNPNMGTTLTVAVVTGHEVFIGHAGDSRAYRLHDGVLEQLTTDHSLAEQLRDEFDGISADPSSPMHNILYNALQANSPRPAHIDVLHAEFGGGDGLVLCSDGLIKELDPDQITRILSEPGDIEDRLDRLVASAKDAGGTDNITAVWVRV